MNTKTMHLPPRRVLGPNKRKEREVSDGPIGATKKPKPIIPPLAGLEPSTPKSSEPATSSNQLMAGFLAHEFLTKGTLFGQPWDSARAETIPPVFSVEPRRVKAAVKSEVEPMRGAELQKEKYQRYVEVAGLLKKNGTHLSGIVNPSQLARFLHM